MLSEQLPGLCSSLPPFLTSPLLPTPPLSTLFHHRTHKGAAVDLRHQNIINTIRKFFLACHVELLPHSPTDTGGERMDYSAETPFIEGEDEAGRLQYLLCLGSSFFMCV